MSNRLYQAHLFHKCWIVQGAVQCVIPDSTSIWHVHIRIIRCTLHCIRFSDSSILINKKMAVSNGREEICYLVLPRLNRQPPRINNQESVIQWSNDPMVQWSNGPLSSTLFNQRCMIKGHSARTVCMWVQLIWNLRNTMHMYSICLSSACADITNFQWFSNSDR